jgi:probable rRNA maturation factor
VTPAFDLAIQGHARFDDLPARATLRRWIGAALDRDAEIALRFVDAREGRKLNREFRGKDCATDVLTFDYDHAPVVRADIILCLPVVKRAARERRRLFRDHLAHLVVHGTLHAQGLDHDDPAAARAMEAREVSILAQLGFGNPYLA